jgi:hypothetical protein
MRKKPQSTFLVSIKLWRHSDLLIWIPSSWTQRILKAESHVACRAHAVSMPCRAAKSLECVFPI